MHGDECASEKNYDQEETFELELSENFDDNPQNRTIKDRMGNNISNIDFDNEDGEPEEEKQTEIILTDLPTLSRVISQKSKSEMPLWMKVK